MVKTPEQIAGIRRACRVCREALEAMGACVGAGVSTADIEEHGAAVLRRRGVRSAFRGYRGYPADFCISVNEEVVHGIPSRGKTLKSGDIVAIDVGVVCDGFVGDCAASFPVGELSPSRGRLLEVTGRALEAGVAAAVHGNRVGDIGAAIQSLVEDAGFSVVRQFAGHGVGVELHEAPEVPNFGRPGTGALLRENMTLAIEPMVNEGTPWVSVLDDGWTVVTDDRRCSAHAEHTVLVRKGKPEVLTERYGDERGKDPD